MTTQVLLPKLGFSVNEAVLIEWLVPDGGEVTKGELLYTLESEKSVAEVEAPVDGRLTILKRAGETYEVGTVIGEIA
jgi:pyruvate/2-oxoglutarate dehydrogenase complex dihydrolipoamide acyltransferase (E2) component